MCYFSLYPNYYSLHLDERGWWFSRPGNDYLAQEESQLTDGYQESVDVVVNAVKEQV